MTQEIIFANANIVTADAVIRGSLVVRDGLIARLDEGATAQSEAIDLGGDYLLPGLVEVHTDNLEKHFAPRPGVRWPSRAAVLAHDAQVASAGITTVFDALAVGDIRAGSARRRDLEDMADTVAAAQDEGLLRADHRVHMRCEVSCDTLDDLIAPFGGHRLVGLYSVMDHTPGQRQFVDDAQYRSYYKQKWGIDDHEIDLFIARQREVAHLVAGPNRAMSAQIARDHDLPLASHDDATPEHIAEATQLGVTLAEFPTTPDAAEAARANGIQVISGAPNLVRGGSHSGNVSAKHLAERGLFDVLSSDYVPYSLIQAAFTLHWDPDIAMPLPDAVATVSRNPARAVGMDDRGEIAPGMAGDLVWVRQSGDLAVVRGVWRRGRRIG